MDYLWSPWRYRYISTAGASDPCIFCKAASGNDDRENLVVHRGRGCYVILNRFPYTSGHLMVVPCAHVATLEELAEETAVEMMLLVRQSEGHLRRIYRPEGLNIGMNLGRCAGAGVAGHVHTHVLPRWTGDANFMTTVGETRVLPEDLADTWEKLTRAFAG
ncbi:MAG TPA: HIT domain-containing protein [Bryobacteraceae bacterium]|nr:HIT domain-containing protein [Bryobacteraceae bacterium]